MNKLSLIFAILLIINITQVNADDLFDSISPNSGTISPRPTVNSYSDIEVNFDALIEAPDTLDITLPESVSITVTKSDFQYRRGYEFRDEDDPPVRQFMSYLAFLLTT